VSDLRVAVVQLRGEVGEVERNLRRAADLVGQAVREHSPGLVLLPESMTSPIVQSPAIPPVARPVDGEPYELLRRLAREHDCWVGGGFLALRGGAVRATYVLAEPGGATHLHDKDQPGFWEAAYCTGGMEDGFCSTPLAPVGLVSGMEWIRSRTAERLRGIVRLLAGGACWWSLPDWPVARPLARRDHDRNVALAREAPGRLARIVGAPAAIAQQVGEVRGETPLVPGVPWRTVLVGESQVAERDGRILARLSHDDGEGYVAADVQLREPEPLDPLPSSFWLPVLPASIHAAWLLQGAHGRARHGRLLRRGAFGRHDGDLYPYNPPDLPPEERPERQIVAHPYGTDPMPA